MRVHNRSSTLKRGLNVKACSACRKATHGPQTMASLRLRDGLLRLMRSGVAGGDGPESLARGQGLARESNIRGSDYG